MMGKMSFELADIAIDRKAVFRKQGIFQSAPTKVDEIYQEAMGLFSASVKPEGLIEEISKEDLASFLKARGITKKTHRSSRFSLKPKSLPYLPLP